MVENLAQQITLGGTSKKTSLGVQMRVRVRVRARVRAMIAAYHLEHGRSRIDGVWLLLTPQEYINSASAGANVMPQLSPTSSF
jgi:hypothetical protein